MKWPIFSFLLFFFLTTTIVGQTADSLKADDFVKKSVSCLKRGQADSSAAYHAQALKIFAANNYLIPWMKSHVKLAYVWANSFHKPLVSIDLLERAIRQAPRQPKTYAEWEQLCLTHMVKAFFYEDYLGDFISAKKEYEASFQIFLHQLDEHSDAVAAYIYFKYGNLCTRLGDYAGAQNLLQAGIDYAKRYNLPNIAKYGDLLIVLLELNKNDEAIEIVKEGLQNSGTLVEPIITLRRCEAKAYLNLGNIAGARNALAQMSGLIKRLKEDSTQTDEAYYWSSYHETLAEIEDASGNYVLSASNYQRAINYEIETWGTSSRREVGKLYWLLGDLYLRQRKPELALNQFQQALRCVLPDFRAENATINPPKSIFYAENTIIECLEGKAKAFRSLNQLEKALECYELIPIVETKLRATHAYESSKLLALDESRLRFDEAVSIAWQLYESSNGDRRYADRAFRLTEQARGMLLLQSLAQAQANFKLPENVRQRETDFNVKLGWYDLEIKSEEAAGKDGDPVRLAQLKKEQFDLSQANENLKSELRRDFPEYTALSEEIRFLESGAVSALLRPGQAMIDYYLTDHDVFVFSCDASGAFSWRKATLPANFRESIVSFVTYLQAGQEDDKPGEKMFRSMAWELYQLLLQPELQRMPQTDGSLIIVPDDALVFIPFEILLQKPAPEGKWTAMSWLLEQYNTAYAYSATLLQMQQNISRKHRERQSGLRYAYSGFAPSYTDPKYYQLTSTEKLVNNVKGLLGGKTWCGVDAKEENFKKIAPDSRILLLAMHGLADAENPELSQLVFGDPLSSNLENDNLLYAGELQIMQLQADLAILSACHSGFGKLRKGEGVFSLARAFARAGVPATVMSLWVLNENSAAPLVQSFVKYLQAGKSKDEALRLAKKDFLHNIKNANLSHPFYWAGVITSGDMCALDLPKDWFSWWWIGLGLLVLGGGWFLMRRRKKEPEYSDIE